MFDGALFVGEDCCWRIRVQLEADTRDQFREGINKTRMMTNNNGFQPRINPMSTSSMYFPNSTIEQRRNTPFSPTLKSFDPFQRDTSTLDDSSTDAFPRALASQSMISMNTASSGKRAGFGKLDSMARNVTTTFKDDSLHDPLPKKDVQVSHEDNVAQSMVGPSSGFGKSFYGFNRNQQSKKLNTQPAEPASKKRRESIDLGFAGRGERAGETHPFMRRNQDAKETTETKPELQVNQNTLEALKQKQFQFMKKRKDMMGSQTTGSMIVGVQSMKNLQQYNQNSSGFKKPEFLSPTASKPFVNDIKCPQDKPKVETPVKSEALFGNIPNFEFKKKKFFESPIEQASSPSSISPMTKKASGMSPIQPLTAKERRNVRPQREIKLSDFELLDKLGKGAFGDVYMAQEKNIGFICVIKKMSKKRIRDTKVEEHILREIKIQSYLNNGNLTALYGYFHDEEYLYLVLEALPDGSLQQVKKKRKLPEKETAAIVKQVSEGLKYMHEEYIIHRDLKPENLFVNQGFIKIGDFGCSIYNHDLGLRNTVVGCLEYSSPEQLSKEGYSDKIDSWSLGILTYELLFGKSPFESDIIKITKNKDHKAELSDLSFPASIPIKEETRDFIENLLAENPDRRMDMDEVLVHPFLKEEMSKKPMKFDLF